MHAQHENVPDNFAQAEIASTKSTRREFLRSSAAVTGATVGALAMQNPVHAAGSDVLKIGVIGCGGRGTGAAVDALTADPHTEITALGDVFAEHAQTALQTLRENNDVAGRIAVKPDQVFIGFDAFRNVIDSGIDVVILATPPHFRPEHLEYAVAQGKHCFVEKPVGVDAPGVLRVQKACDEAERKGLAVVSGLCWRYEPGVLATMEQIAEGAIGDIVAIESSYNVGTLWHRGNKPDWSEMEYQLRNWYYFTWLSGDHIVEQAIHSIDKTAWLLGDTHPQSALGFGGRQQRTDEMYGNIFDHHVVFYRYSNGVPVYFTCRQQANCASHVDELVLGTKGQARILANRIVGENPWRYRGPKPSMYRAEQEAMFQSIRQGKPLNNGHYMTNSNLIALMGRMSSYTGQKVIWDDVLNSQDRLGPESYEWGDVSYRPVAIPGVTELG